MRLIARSDASLQARSAAQKRRSQRTIRPLDELVAEVPDVSGTHRLPPVLLEVLLLQLTGDFNVPSHHVTMHVVQG